MRAEPRGPVHINATLRMFGSREKHAVVLRDISQSGLGLMVPIALTAGQQVAVDIGHGIAIGEIRYCHVTTDGYRVGLLVLEFLNREGPVAVDDAGKQDRDRRVLAQVIALIGRRRNGLLSQPNVSAGA